MKKEREAAIIAEILKEATSLPITKSVKRKRNNASRRANKNPLTGAYYWIPILQGKKVQWEIMEFYDNDYGGYPGDAEHAKVWSEVINYLSFKWHKSENDLWQVLEDELYGLPRGRVNLFKDGRYGIAHGQDAPIPNWATVVKRIFNLTGVEVVAYEDDHEHMLPGSLEIIKRHLGI